MDALRFLIKVGVFALVPFGVLVKPGAAGAQTILAETAEVVESDSGAVEAVFQYALPAGPEGRTVELALVPQQQKAGEDYVPYRSVLTSVAGNGLNGTVRVPVTGDALAEPDGTLNMIMRGPDAVDWAGAMSSPVNEPVFPVGGGGGRLVYWQDDLVVAVRLSNSTSQSFIDTWERTAAGGLVLRSTLTSSNESFMYGNIAVSRQNIVSSYDGRIRTWVRRTDNPYLWTEKSGLGNGQMGAVFLQGDRLFATSGFRIFIFRQDPSLPTGWRMTGEVGGVALLTVGEDVMLTESPGLVQVHERVSGTEDVWVPVYQTPAAVTGNFRGAAGEGMFVVPGPGGLEVHERGAAGIWSRVNVLPLPAAGGLEMGVAMAGDWIAVGMGSQFFPSPPGTVRLFLRGATDRSQWDAVGILTGPGQGYGRQLIWNGGELVSASYPNADAFHVVTRRFNGAKVKVLDNDRTKPAVLTFTQPEPVGGSVTVDCFAELLLPATAPVTVNYQLFPETALAGTDFLPASGSVVIPVGSSRAAIPVTVLADGVLEPEETFRIELSVTGHSTVQGTMRIRDFNPAAVVTASATPLLEGQGQSQVTVRQTASTGSSLAGATGQFEARFGGFENPAATTPPKASLGTDVASSVASLTISEAMPQVTWQASALQDELEEAGDELTSAVLGGLTRSHESGTMGLGYEGNLPPPPVGATGVTSTYGPVAAGDWLFVVHGGGTLPGESSSDLIGCYRWAADGSPVLVPVQQLPVKEGSGQVHLSSDGRLLAISYQRSSGGVARGFLDLYEADGPAAAPWRKVSTWSKETPYFPFINGINVVNRGNIIWGGWLMERTGGHYQWRMTNTTVFTPDENSLGPFGEYLDADGDWLLVRGPAYAEVVAYKRRRSGLVPWVSVRSFTRSREGNLEGFGRARIRGSSLFLLDAAGRVEIHRETAAGSWRWEQTLPAVPVNNYLYALGESTVCWGGMIYSRMGPAAAPWIVSGTLPVVLDTEDVVSTGGILTRSRAQSSTLPRLVVVRPGLPLAISDDDSLKFTIRLSQDGTPAGFEPYSGESVARLGVWATRPSPIPFQIRVRSRDAGSAMAGVDYAPVDFLIPVPALGASAPYFTEFPVRIFSDRLQEGNETLELLMESAVFGKAVPVTQMQIVDWFRSGIRAVEPVPVFWEPVGGERIQAVEFQFRNAFANDFQFTASVDAGGTASPGLDYILPAGDLTLKAGETRLRVPIRVLPDAADESRETILLRINSNPALTHFSAGVEVTLMDAEVPGLLADPGYLMDQGTTLSADGAGGNPAGTAANDPAAPPGTYTLWQPPSWGTVNLAGNGNFTATPDANVSGPVTFAYQVVTVPFQRFLDAASGWKYLHPAGGANPATANPAFPGTWATAAFDDSSWASGIGTITYGGFEIPNLPGIVNLSTPPSGSRYTSYFRKVFTSAEAVTVPLKLSLYCDDGVVIYINGVERGRAHTTTSTTFATAPDTHTMLTGGSQLTDYEGTLQTVNLGNVPLLAGNNLLAVSLHNATATSSDLGIRLVSLETGVVSEPVPVSIQIAAVNRPLSGKPDFYNCPQNADLITSDEYGASLLDNDGLTGPDGSAYDPLLELITGPVSAGVLSVSGSTGHFRYTPPVDFTGEAWFEYQLRDKDGLSAPVRVTLNVQPTLPFDLWRVEALSAGAPTLGDPDADGLNTFLEYTLGTDPASGVLGSGKGFVVSPDGRGLSLMVRKSADLAWRIEAAESPDAESWQLLKEGRGLNYMSPVSPEVVIRSMTADSVTVEILPSASGSVRRFYRLRSQRIPL